MTRMDCSEVRDLIQAYDDGELPAAERVAVAGHLLACATCSAALTDLQTLRTAIRATGAFALPAGLESRVRASMGSYERDSSKSTWRRFAGLAASHMVAVGLGTLLAYSLLTRNDERAYATRDIFAAHARSLVGEHLLQVASADTHTVKPWFAGKVPYAPDIKDLSAKNFPLHGGRLDYMLDRAAAVAVYGRRKHLINVFMMPADQAPGLADIETTRNGYNLIAWTDRGFSHFATSDLNMPELRDFTRELGRVTR